MTGSILAKSRHAIASLLLACAHAFAQESSTATPPASTDDRVTTLQQVEVTGSHIRSLDLETQHPILVLERAELLRTGLTDIADILQTITANGQTLNRNVNNGADGELRVNLRSLGSNRTLVLVNGQRWAAALDGGVDLSAIPLALVDRVEVLKDGASAIYGSDAIAGVVNIITRHDYKGAELGIYGGQNDYGDGLHRSWDLTFGSAGDGWSAAAGLEYEKYDPIIAGNRAISAVPFVGLPPATTGSAITPYTNLLPASGDDYLRLIAGRAGTSPGDFRAFDALHDRYNYTAGSYLQTPADRKAIFAQARYELSPSLAVVADLLRNQRGSAQQLASPVVTFSPYSDGPDSRISIAPDNLYNPFGESIIAAQRRFSEAGPRRLDETVDTTRMHLGLDGLFALAGRDFNWGADFTAIHVDEHSFTDSYVDDRRLAAALGPSFRDAAGIARCGTPDAVIAGCVPLNLFGPPGSITPAMLAYIDQVTHERKRGDLRDFNLHANGALVELPAGPLGVAAGVEHRSDRGSDDLDPLIRSGNANGSGSGSFDSTKGSDAVSEAYVEFDMPLLKDRLLARRLDITFASRYSNYSEFGDTTNSQLGLRWKPIDDLLVRGNYSQGFRAPSIVDLFAGATRASGPFVDPCAVDNPPNPAVMARCRALGVPSGVAQPLSVDLIGGGNPDLQPETATTRTLGLVYSPRAFDGLETSLDWYRIQVRHAIGQTDVYGIVDDCYLRADTPACRFIRRGSDGTLLSVAALPQNLPGGIETEGVDFGLAYRRATSFGNFSVRWENSYVSYYGELGQPKRLAPMADGSFAQGNVVGENSSTYGVTWRLRSVLGLHWERDAWNVSVSARYFSPIDEDCSVVTYYAGLLEDPSLNHLCSNPDRVIDLDGSGVGQPAPENRIASVTYFDLDIGWTAPWKARFSVGVRNALDRDPPVSYSGLPFYSDYDIPGRFWYASYRQSF